MYFKQPDSVSVHSGFPNPATDSSLQTLDLNKLLIKNSASTFFMRLGSWSSLGITAGDIAIVDRALEPKPNDLIIWYDAERLTISKTKRVPMQTPVWGVVTSVIHMYRFRP